MDSFSTLERPPSFTGAEPAAAELVVLFGPARGSRVTLQRSRGAVFGRSGGSVGLALRDALASRLHFEVSWQPARAAFELVDLESRNGTFVNRARVQTAALQDGDIVRAGDSLLVFVHNSTGRCLEADRLRAAASDLNVLVLGESGAGKEVLARAIHETSARKGAFIAVNCAALPRDLVGSELFGHVRGAFSGAQHAREGLFEAARGGTLLLDEIGDMPQELQPALLRVLDTRAVRPVGADREVPVDVRILGATHQDLASLVAENRFRGDLFARLAQITIHVPPLRARREQILTLVDQFAAERGKSLQFECDAAETLLLWRWPYNVRELRSLVHVLLDSEAANLVTWAKLKAIRPDLAVPAASADPAPPRAVDLDGAPKTAAKVLRDRELLIAELSAAGDNVAALARRLGTSRSHVYRWLARWGLDRPRQ